MSYWPRNLTVRPIQAWPGPLTVERKRSPFGSSWSSTLDLLDRELWHASARRTVLQVAIPEQMFRSDGYPRATAKAEHPGVILSFESPHGPLSFPCDQFLTWQDNVRAIALALEALRKVDRYGITRRGEQYTGWRALPGGSDVVATSMTQEQALELLERETGIAGAAGLSLTNLWRLARANAHPDRNAGDRSRWDAVEQAGRVLGLVT